jgi:mRNA-degrading endonuclease toxin of MazEF toxin-antitoxin module
MLDTNFINEILEISGSHQKGKRSFVIVSPTAVPDQLPEALTWAPTLQEAKDLIEMDEMQRDLGF